MRPCSFLLQHSHFVPDLPNPIHSLTNPPHIHSLIHPLLHSVTLLLPPSSNCACIYSLVDFLLFSAIGSLTQFHQSLTIPHTHSLIIHTPHSHSDSQIPTHSFIHLSMTSFLQLYSCSLIRTSSELLCQTFHRSCW